MITSRLIKNVLATYLLLSGIDACSRHKREHEGSPESAAVSTSYPPVKRDTEPIPLITVSIDDVTFRTNTTFAKTLEVSADPVTATKVNSTALVIARDSDSAYSAYSGLNDHGIPYTLLTVPKGGVELPSLNNSATVGNYGLIVVLSEVSYDYGGSDGYQSALTSRQWAALFRYQLSFGIRMVRLDAYPSEETGTRALGDCCDDGVEQVISISNAAAFPAAGLRVGAVLSTAGLWHYPASITNRTIATEIAQFGASRKFNSNSTAAVINNIGGRQQMVFFLPFSTDWSLTSALLQHAWIIWATRGLYSGRRRVFFGTQVDDMFLETEIYSPQEPYRIGTVDLDNHITFMKNMNAKMNAGSEWWIEIGHNGNGNIEVTDNGDDEDDPDGICTPGPIEYDEQIDTPLEFVKPPGSGTNLWPDTTATYPNYTKECLEADELMTWWSTPDNLNAFAHVSHTFTHEDQNNATYYDVLRELSWNQGWLAAVGIASAKRFSPIGLIPPAITGLHNGDALQAWFDVGITNAVGDNTRSALLNKANEHWPLISTVKDNGFAGIQITPRWATLIYYNCDTPDCTVKEWIDTSAGKGNITDLLELEKSTNVRHLLTLHHDAFMFHQANLMYKNAPKYTINGVTAQLSLLQAWVETVVQEFVRLVTWPLISLKHDDLATSFRQRLTRDACQPNLIWDLDIKSNTITGATVTSAKMACSEALPVTFPGPVTDTQGFQTEQIGSDPLTIWVVLSGKPVSFKLSAPVPV